MSHSGRGRGCVPVAGLPSLLTAGTQPENGVRTEPIRLLYDTAAADADPDNPLLQFLPEACEQSIVTESILLLLDPARHEVRDEPQDLTLHRNDGARPIERTEAIGIFHARSVQDVGDSLATYVRAAGGLVAAVTGRAATQLIAGIKTMKRVCMAGYGVRITYPARARQSWRNSVASRVSGWGSVRVPGMIGFTCGIAVGVLGMRIFAVRPPLEVTSAWTHPATVEAAPPIFLAPVHDGSAWREDPQAAPTVGTTSIGPGLSPQIVRSDHSAENESPTTARPQSVANLPRESSLDEAPPIPFRGSLSLQSGPEGAQAFVDGKAVGSTPIVLTDLPAGSRVVRVEAEGYQTWSAAVRVIANQQIRVTATLYREPSRP